MMCEADRFVEELRTFEARRAAFVDAGHERKWVIVRGGDLRGPFETADEAWRAGVDAFGAGQFMLKRIDRTDEPVVVTHVFLDADHDASSAPR